MRIAHSPKGGPRLLTGHGGSGTTCCTLLGSRDGSRVFADLIHVELLHIQVTYLLLVVVQVCVQANQGYKVLCTSYIVHMYIVRVLTIGLLVHSTCTSYEYIVRCTLYEYIVHARYSMYSYVLQGMYSYIVQGT